MKKVKFSIILIITILIAMLTAYFYLVHKFEQQLNLDVIQNNKDFTFESIEVNKYIFKVSFKKPKINNQNFLSKVDEVAVWYVPIINLVRLSTDGQIIILDKEGKESIVQTFKNLVVWGNVQIGDYTNKQWDIKSNWDLKVYIDNFHTFSNKTNKTIFELENANFKINHNLLRNLGMAEVDISSKFKILIEDITGLSDFESDLRKGVNISDKNYSILTKFIEGLNKINHPSNYDLKFYAKYDSELYDSELYDSFKLPLTFVDNEIFISNFCIKGALIRESKYAVNNYNFEFDSLSKSQTMDYKFDLLTKFKNHQEFDKVFTDMLYNLLPVFTDQKITKEEFFDVFSTANGKDKFQLNLKGSYNITETSRVVSAEINLNDAKVKIDAANNLKDDSFEMVNIDVSVPGLKVALIEIIDYLNNKLAPFVFKVMKKPIYTSPPSLPEFKKSLSKVIDEFNKNGPNKDQFDFNFHLNYGDITINKRSLIKIVDGEIMSFGIILAKLNKELKNMIDSKGR